MIPRAYDILTARAGIVLTFRAWCLLRSDAVLVRGKRGALLRLLGDLHR